MLQERFQIKYEIGRGAMGTVYKGYDFHSSQPVAIKCLKPELVTPAMLERFRREGEALQQLNHPNIVRFVDTFEDGGQHYLVLEYIDGANLKDSIQQGTLDLPQVIDISLGIADALTRAHHLNIIHRDIKPANILIAQDGNVYLTDFGVAAFGELAHLTETDGVVGTIPYLSPEILEGRSVSEKSDIWAFGVVLYEMVTGDRPFQGDHAGTLTRAILFDDVPDLEGITDGAPVALIDLIYRMLEKDPMFRIPSVRLVGVELEALKKGYVPYTPRQLKRDEPPTAIIESRFSTPMPTRHTLNNLPSALTPFVGREAELKELERLLSTERLISIVAPGGMGKTRLAGEAANRQLGQWEHGVYFVDLAPISSPDAIPGKIAEATRFQFYEGVEPREQILSFLREKRMLLVMDNFEHVLEGVELVREILQTASNVTIVSTSRERLNLQGETLFTISGMDFPDWETPEDALEYAAVKLFMQSACRTNPAFELHEEDLMYISRICRLVEGMPLGILLAASWVHMLTPEEIAGEIEQSLDFLETDQHDMPARQRSIRAVFDSTWQRLSQHEQDIFAAMSVFRGGFTREAAQAVTGANLRDLMVLVNRSMIARQPDGRYAIHELMRQYAAEQVSLDSDLESDVREKHCHYFLNFVAERDYALKTAEQFVVMRELEPEIENVEAAWKYATDNRYYEQFGAVIEPLSIFHMYLTNYARLRRLLEYSIDRVEGVLLGRMLMWSTICFFETKRTPERLHQAFTILDHPDTPPGDLVDILTHMGLLERNEAFFHRAKEVDTHSAEPWSRYLLLTRWCVYKGLNGEFREAVKIASELIQLLQDFGNVVLLVDAYLRAALMESNLMNIDRALELNQKALELARKVGLERQFAAALTNQASSLAQIGRVDEAIAMIKEAIAINRRLGRRWWIYASTDTYAQILFDQGRLEEARALFKECYEIVFTEFQDHSRSKSFIANRLGFVELRVGDLAVSRKYFTDALRYLLGVVMANNLNRLNSLVGLAHVKYEEGDCLRALAILYVVSQWPMPEGQDSYIEAARQLIAKLEAELSPEDIAAARQQADALDLFTLIEQILSEHGEDAHGPPC